MRLDPDHYTSYCIEPLQVIENWRLGFHLGNVVKYIARHKTKGQALEDMRKALDYLERYVELLEKEE